MKPFRLVLLGIAVTLSAFAHAEGHSNRAQGPSGWNNSYTAPDGTIWSDILPDTYANCISEKDPQGKPILSSVDVYICQQDSNGNLLGTSSDHRTVVDSDAVQACTAMGGELPTIQDFKNLGSDYQDVPNMGGNWYWSSSLDPKDTDLAQGFVGDTGYGYVDDRFFGHQLHCVRR
jgi:hypothetical protein